MAKYKKEILSVFVGILVFCAGVIRLCLDNTVQMKVVYWFFQDVDQECILSIEYEDDIYEIEPHFPMEDTYAAGWFEITYDIPKREETPKSFSFELAHEGDTAEVRSIEFYNHNLQTVKYSPADIGILFETQTGDAVIDNRQINLKSGHEKIILDGNALFLQEYYSLLRDDTRALYNCAALSAVCMIVCFYLMKCGESRKKVSWKIESGKKGDIFWAAALLAVYACSCIMAFTSKHYAHADEYVSREAIDYYLGQWLPPRFGSHWHSGTYSLHGFSRLDETTLYYFFAGKVGWVFREFFHLQKYYRVFGLLLLAVVLITIWKRREKNRWLMLAVCITPQIWYLFSYATSDHWDYFWAFWIVIITVDRESILYRTLRRERITWRTCLAAAVCALLFAQMFLGKSNYMIILGIPFVELLVYWIQNERGSIHTLLRYAALLILTWSVFMAVGNIPRMGEAYSVKMSADEMQTALENANVVQELSVEVGESEAPAAEDVDFWDMMWNYSYMPTPALLFTSAIGCYVWNSLWGGKLYTIVMMALYIGIAAGFIVSLIREEGWAVKLKIIFAGLLSVLMFGVTIWYCYHVVYEPQGRYLLPVFAILAYAAAYAKEFVESRYYRWLVAASCAAGLWCLGYAGLFTMYRNGILFLG